MLLQSYLTDGNNIVNLNNFVEGITFKQDINPNADLTFGVVSSASIDFKVLDGSPFESNSNAWAWWFDGVLQGYYYPKEKKIGTYDRWTITCYDCVSLLDTIADTWLTSLTYPLTLEAFKDALGNYVGLTIPDVIESNFLIYNNFMAKNITCRQILEYIAQIEGCCYVASKDAVKTLRAIYPDDENTVVAILDGSVYNTFECSREPVAVIDKVQIQSTSDDVGYIAGTGENTYIITGNPLLFTTSQTAQIQTLAESLLGRLSALTSFYSAKLTGSNINLLPYQVGNRITANGKDFIVLSKTLSPSGSTLDGEINLEREITTQDNSAITMLNNKMNEISSTVEGNTAKITEITGQMEEEVATLTTKINEVEQTADNLSITVSETKSKVDDDIQNLQSQQSKLEMTASGISTRVEEVSDVADEASTKASTVQQTVDSLTYIDDQGQVKISGGNVYLTGLITWNDLNTNVQNKIEDGGLTEDEIQSLIDDSVPTLITNELVSSPTIAGANFEDRNRQMRLQLNPNIYNNRYTVGGTMDLFSKSGTNWQNVFQVYYSGDTVVALSAVDNPFLTITTATGTVSHPQATWDFSDATVIGLETGGGTATAVFG